MLRATRILTNKNGMSVSSASFVNSDPRVGIMDKIGISVCGVDEVSIGVGRIYLHIGHHSPLILEQIDSTHADYLVHL